MKLLCDDDHLKRNTNKTEFNWTLCYWVGRYVGVSNLHIHEHPSLLVLFMKMNVSQNHFYSFLWDNKWKWNLKFWWKHHFVLQWSEGGAVKDAWKCIALKTFRYRVIQHQHFDNFNHLQQNLCKSSVFHFSLQLIICVTSGCVASLSLTLVTLGVFALKHSCIHLECEYKGFLAACIELLW